MSTSSGEKPWTEDENYALLAEILKKAGVPSHTLLAFIRERRIEPSWEDIPLPPGRPLKSCRTAYENMQQAAPPPTFSGLGAHLSQHPIAPAAYGSVPSTSANPKKRPIESADRPPQREILPRPAAGHSPYSIETGASTNFPQGMGSIATANEPRKKRGRPTKAEVERRQEMERLGSGSVARGQTNPSREPMPYQVSAHSTPASPFSNQPGGSPYATQPSSRPLNAPLSGYHPPSVTTPLLSGFGDTERIGSRENFSSRRELPPPQEHRKSLPLPPVSQLGPRDHMPRIEPGDRPYGSTYPERVSYTNTSQMPPIAAIARRPDEPPAPNTQVPLTTTAEKRT
ncbi:putative AT DNA binding protein [Aspergillus stella-maris]|uniref:putative AT DNA binding protein n=1 Tax=Aspergillus stella-maris TaxID=1810926 RepID=UPI003CCE28E2